MGINNVHFVVLNTDQPSSVAARSLILISKVVGTVASGAEFGGKEDHMCLVPLHQFLATHSTPLTKFLSSLTVRQKIC